ncbi:MAG TPA: penicillin-binding protein activator [Steroidobacteraceae bacterium]|nr:penicillin-binding protein activator [Steroidobacteraceae bacterium]
MALQPMSPARWIPGSAALAVACALSGCPSLTNVSPPPSLDRAARLEQAGDAGGAARIYEALAGQNSGADRSAYLLRAAHAWLGAHRADEAARVLSGLEGTLTPEQQTERALLSAEIALERGQIQEAWRQLDALPMPANPAQAARYRDLKARAAVGAGHPEAAEALAREQAEVAPHIALLLPVTGRTNAAAVSVRDGFLAAWYQSPAAERLRVRVYDTGTESVAEALTRAAGSGAELIVGPLTREEVIAAAQFAGTRPPVLALNFLGPETPAPPRFYQDALSPEEEARLVARRILADHHRRGVALAPAGDWGTRVLAAFRQELEAGGGELIATASIDGTRTDYSEAVTQILGISESQARYRRLEGILGTKLQFEPRRRADIGFIFAPAPANTERLLRPQLRFHFAGDIATYATSAAFEPDVRANQDLDGLIFPDMPWILGGDLAEAVRAATRDAWPNAGFARSRLFAFGFDAWRLAVALLNRPNDVNIDGLTGRLSFDAEHRVRRELAWAQLHDGQLRPLPAPTP